MHSDHSYVTVNRKPVVPGHLLVIPRRTGVPMWTDLSPSEVSDLFVLVKKLMLILNQFPLFSIFKCHLRSLQFAHIFSIGPKRPESLQVILLGSVSHDFHPRRKGGRANHQTGDKSSNDSQWCFNKLVLT
jgi:hypothetical protein